MMMAIRLFLAFLLGSIFGSFFHTIYWRREQNISILKPRSFCPHCGHQLSWIMLIPVFSYLRQRGRCSDCNHKINRESFYFEWIFGIVTLVMVHYGGIHIENLVRIFQLYVLLTLSYTDFKSQDIYTMDLGLLFLTELLLRIYMEQSLSSGLINGLILGLIFYLIRKITGGLGQGDVEMAFVCGFFTVNFYELFLIFEAAFVSGAVISLFLIILRIKGRKDAIAFGPFLALALGILFLVR